MRNILVKFSCLGLALVLLGSSVRATPESPDAPIAIPMTDGQWRFLEGGSSRVRFARQPTLVYQAAVFPRLTLNLLKLQCSLGGGQRIEVTGMIPAQRFPQPAISLTLSGRTWTAIPDAGYRSRSSPQAGPSLPDSMLDDNLKGANLSFPGHPAYADLSFFRRLDPETLDSVRMGGPVRIQFDDQQRLYPAIPAELAARYAEACGELMLPPIARR